MKVIRVDNYDGDGPNSSQQLVAGPGLSLDEAERIAREMNDDIGRCDCDYFKVVPDDHVLWRFEP